MAWRSSPASNACSFEPRTPSCGDEPARSPSPSATRASPRERRSGSLERGIRLLGVDFLSVEQRGAAGHPVHHALLERGVVIVEGLDLGAVDPGRYHLTVLPLKIRDGDGGPARAILREG